jgi:hypothetical protein
VEDPIAIEPFIIAVDDEVLSDAPRSDAPRKFLS